jgi:hypothetical protein
MSAKRAKTIHLTRTLDKVSGLNFSTFSAWSLEKAAQSFEELLSVTRTAWSISMGEES